MHRRPSTTLSHRPKTSSAVDDHSSSQSSSSAPPMKRTASQTFTTYPVDARDTPAPLEAVSEAMFVPDYLQSSSASSYHQHSSSLSRASAAIGNSFKHVCRRLSSSSTRRPSLASILDPKPNAPAPEAPHSRLQHQDSGMPVPNIFGREDVSNVHSMFSLRGRLGSIRRRPATSGPAGDTARYNPAPPTIPANYPTTLPLPFAIPVPGSAARAAAAAANNERMRAEKIEQEQTARFLAGVLPSHHLGDVMKDSESGVGMACSSPIQRNDNVQEKRLDPITYLPTELSALILSNLDASSLIHAEQVSTRWHSAASSQHVWRNVFLRKYEPQVHVSPTPIMMGGAGIGKMVGGKPAPAQQWKRMYRTRMTINRRWRACSPRAIYLNGHTDSVYCCQFDENKIITGSRDRTIRVWDMKTFKCLKVIGGPSNRPTPNTPPQLETHKEMVVNNPSMNGTSAGHSIYYVPTDYHEASILCLQYDDKIMVTGSSDHTCIMWDITGPEFVPIRRLRGHTAGVLDVCLDDKHIISCSKDATINVWDRATGTRIRTLSGHRGPVNAVQLRGHLLVSASGDGVAKLWNLDTGSCVKEFPSQDRGLAAVEFSDDAHYLLAGGNDHVVYKFDANTGQLLHTSTRHGGLVRSLFLDAHNGRVISGSYDQSIRIADYRSGEVFGLYENWTTSWILSAKSDYRRVVATSQDGRALILDFGWGVDGVNGLVG